MDRARLRPIDVDTHNAVVALAYTVGRLMFSVTKLRTAVAAIGELVPAETEARDLVRSAVQESATLSGEAYDELVALMEALAVDG